jgi:glycosyltransferase involved in cell wall biosynthesis
MDAGDGPAAPWPGRLVFVNRYYHPDLSATSQILGDLARHLAAAGAEVHVVCSRQLYDDPDAALPAAETVDGVRVHRLRTSRFGRARLAGRAVDYLSFYLACGWELPWLLRRGDVAVAKTDPPLIGLVVAAAARLRGAQLVNWLQDVFPEVATQLGANPLPPPLQAALQALRDRGLRAARLNVVLGQRMRELLLRRGVPQQRIGVVENWATAGEEPGAALPAGRSRLRASLALDGRFVVGYSGNLGRAHDHLAILEAAAALAGEPGFVFLMIGGGAGMSLLRAEAERRGLRNLRFLPYQPREALADSLAAADVHLVSLRPELEGLIVPSKFYGVLAAARPVLFIGAADGELPQIIRAAGCGACADDGATLAAALRRMRGDAAALAAMGARARQLFEQRYTAHRALSQWTRLLRAAAEDTVI